LIDTTHSAFTELLVKTSDVVRLLSATKALVIIDEQAREKIAV
jgi:hypothetical protein